MARTKTFGQTWNLISRGVGRTVEDSSAAEICNMAQDLIWNGWDWRESLVSLPPFWLVPNQQDYGKPLYAVPSDFLGLRQAYLVKITSTPVYRYPPLAILQNLQETHVRAFPHAIGYEPSVQGFRIFHRAPDNIGASEYLIDGTYKKRPTAVTPLTIANTVLPFDDLYLPVWIQALRWAAWDLAGDPRADQQLQKAYGFIDAMAINEGFNMGDNHVYPSESLGPSRTGGSLNMGYPGWNG